MDEIGYDKLTEAIQDEIQWQIKEWAREQFEEFLELEKYVS